MLKKSRRDIVRNYHDPACKIPRVTSTSLRLRTLFLATTVALCGATFAGCASKPTMRLNHAELSGVQLGFHTVLVLSGGTKSEDLPRYAYRPEVVVESLAEFADLMAEHDWHPPWQREAAKTRRLVKV